ncbi:MAG: PAS domain-containing protein [Chloroflexi bacterium]|nr:PAS domain-containing protein [Chloroflexota bacterium]
MVWQDTPYTLPLIAAALLSASFAVLLVWRFKTRGAVISAVLIMAGSWWLLCVALNLAGGDLPTKTFWGKLKYIGIEIMPIGFVVLALESLGYGHWLRQRRVWLIGTIPAVLLVLILTNDYHHLVWPSYANAVRNAILVSENPKGILYWVNYVYIYICIIATMLLLLRAAFNSRHLYRRQAVVLLIGPLAIWLVTFLEAFGMLLGLPLSPMPLAWIFAIVTITISNFRLKTGDVIPIARQAILDSIPEGVIVLDTARRVLDINPAACRAFGNGTEQTVIGQPVETFWPVGAALVQAESNATIPKELTAVQDGEQHIYDISVSPTLDADQQLRGHIIVLRDVTRLRQAAQQSFDLALERERMKLLSGFIQDASHEFRTPLAAIRLSTYLAGKTTDPDRRDYHLRNIDNQVHNITQLVESLVLMARLDSFAPLTLGTVDVNNLVTTVCKSRHKLLEDKCLRLLLELDPSIPPLRACFDLLAAAVGHLVENAAKFNKPDGSIRIATCLGDREVVIQIEDTGIGINREHLEAIFNRFYRVEQEAHTIPGFGLGLTIAQAIAERHGGRIEVESTPDVGSRFSLRLPLR